MKAARIATLRPMMPVEELARLMGSLWSPPDSEGRVPNTFSRGFSVQVDVAGKVGKVGFYKTFQAKVMIEGLSIGMPLADALAARSGLQRLPDDPEMPAEWTHYADRTEAGFALLMRVRDNRVGALEISNPDAVYPEPEKLLADPRLTLAYDLLRDSQSPLPATQRDTQWSGGWSLGLPPGITQHQWPLSKRLGYPLRHAFTLHLPAQYRTQGADHVALSLFVDDQLEELPSNETIEAFFAAELSQQPPSDPALIPLWEHRRARHPMSFEMSDILGTAYVAIWLTQAEFDGALCPVPELAGNPLLEQAPGWLEQSYADYFYSMKVRNFDAPAYAWLPGEGRAAGIETAFAIRAQVREGDPNVGKPPREREEECQDSGYVPAFGEHSDALGLTRLHGRNHLGGTMFPEQAYPEFSPFYLEFEEDFGGFNFGGGNGQLDLQKMELDWACG